MNVIILFFKYFTYYLFCTCLRITIHITIYMCVGGLRFRRAISRKQRHWEIEIRSQLIAICFMLAYTNEWLQCSLAEWSATAPHAAWAKKTRPTHNFLLSNALTDLWFMLKSMTLNGLNAGNQMYIIRCTGAMLASFMFYCHTYRYSAIRNTPTVFADEHRTWVGDKLHRLSSLPRLICR